MFATRRASAVASVLVIAALAGDAAGSPLELFGFGGRSPGMAGTGVATATDYDAVYLNPAGLADIAHKRLTFGYLFGDFDLERDGNSTRTEHAEGVVFGGALPIPLGGVMQNRLGFGVAFYIPTKTLNRARAPFPGVPVMALLESRAHTVGIQIGFGVKITDWLRVGAGTLMLAGLDGKIHVSTDAAGRFATQSEQKLVTAFAPIVGVRALWRRKRMQFGLTFRGVSKTEYRIFVTNDLQETLPLTVPTLDLSGVSQYDPLSVVLGWAWEVKHNVVVQAQLDYQRWSAFPLPTENPVAGSPPQDEPGFSDTVVPRVAGQWVIKSDHKKAFVVRGGYHFIKSPAPEMTGRQSFLDNSRHVLSIGAGVYLPGTAAPVYIDVWGQVHYLVPRSHTKDPNLFGPDEELPFMTTRTRGRITVAGVTIGVDI